MSTRRRFLYGLTASATLAGCKPKVPLWCEEKGGPGTRYIDDLPQELRAATASAPEGLHYYAGAPERSNLVVEGEKGTILSLSGLVKTVDDEPLPGLRVEIWGADDKGKYDKDLIKMRHRGYVLTEPDGAYAFRTIEPAHYKVGDTEFKNWLRARHIHLKVWDGQNELLTTQIFFEGDPYLNCDPFVKTSLITPFDEMNGQLEMFFDIVLGD